MASNNNDNVRKVGRDSKTGEFIPIKEALRRPATTEVEKIHYPKHPPKGKGK